MDPPFGLLSPLVKPRHIGYVVAAILALAWIVGVMWLMNGHW